MSPDKCPQLPVSEEADEATARKIVHIDMDAFFASVEQRDNPALRGRPVAVGGAPERRGVVAACSYEARAFGIHSAMPSAKALRLCPELLFVRPHFDVYRRESARIQAIFRRFTPLVEPLSLDEAYLDVTATPGFGGSATRVASRIKELIAGETGLTASAGVSFNKFLAKIASDMDKPDGLFVIAPGQAERFVAGLPVRRFHGIGAATERRMHRFGIYTGEDLRSWPLERLVEAFGKAGGWYFQIARARDERPVVPHRVRKSLGKETTFPRDLQNLNEILAEVETLAARVAAGLGERRLAAQTLTLKLRYADFELVTRSHTPGRPLVTHADMLPLLEDLVARTQGGTRRVRLLGVSASGLLPLPDVSEAAQLGLFEPSAD